MLKYHRNSMIFQHFFVFFQCIIFTLQIMSFIRKIKKGNAIYLAEVENHRNKDGKVVQKHIRYLGKEIDGKPARQVYSSEIEVQSVKKYYDFYMLHEIAKKLGIEALLGDKMKHILLLVYTQIIARKSMYKLPEYIDHTALKEILEIEKIVDKSLYTALDAIEEMDFGYIESKILQKFMEMEKDNDSFILDVTDTYFSGSQANWKARKGKDGKYDKVVQIALGVTGIYGFPITHKIYEGNISNIMIFKDLISNIKLANFDITIMDRGMNSLEILNDLLVLKQKVITGLRSNNIIKTRFIDPIDKDDIYCPECRVKLKNSVVYVKSFDYLDGKLIVIYNPEIEISEKEKAMQAETYDKVKAKYYGFSFIFHTTAFTADEVVRKYFEKDIVEKAYKNLKSSIDLHPIRHYRLDRVSAHVKICYLAYAILAYLQYKMKPLNLSANDALDALQCAYQVELVSTKEEVAWKKNITLTKNQLAILKSLDCGV